MEVTSQLTSCARKNLHVNAAESEATAHTTRIHITTAIHLSSTKAAGGIYILTMQ
jgi:hypothetical protein